MPMPGMRASGHPQLPVMPPSNHTLVPPELPNTTGTFFDCSEYKSWRNLSKLCPSAIRPLCRFRISVNVFPGENVRM